ncbi:MAG: InlB B-repeat-containing protein, partial [Oscillospiraceae bacterium]|nr:InlB B-repeat-containing protein [Oscillospiraceae bacterium]
MKRFLSLMLSIVMIFTAIPTVFAATDKVTMQASHSTAYVGETVTFIVSVNGAENASSAAVDVSFTDNFEFVSAEWLLTGGFMSDYDSREDKHKGIFAYDNFDGNMNGDIFKLTLKAKTPSADMQDVSINVQHKKNSTTVLNETAVNSVKIIGKLTGTLAVTGVSAPVKNAVPVGESDITAPENTTITSVDWSPAHSAFAAETVYSVIINVKADAGYEFANGVAFTVDSENWTAEKQADGSYNLSRTFPATAAKDTPVCVAPANITATYGQTLSEITLTNSAGNTEGTWSWMTPSASVGNASAAPVNFKAKFVPADTANYLTVENIDVPVTVNAKNITVSVAAIADQEYTGSQIKPVVAVTGDGKTLALGTDYTVDYGENINAGTGTVTVKAKADGNYTFTDTAKDFNIVAKAGTVSISGDLNVTFGTAVPDVTINTNGSDGATTVYYYTNQDCTEGKTTTKPTNAGNYWVQVEMVAGTNYTSAESNVLEFTISRADITPAVTITGWTYKDSANDASVTGNTGNGTVTYEYKVKDASDDTYTQTIPVNAGEYTVKAEIAQTANYNAGSATTNFTIAPKALDNAMVAEVAVQAYTGNEIKPAPAVTDGTELQNNTDFTYSYKNNIYVGTTAEVKVTGQGNYSGEIVKEFSIIAIDQTPAITPTTHVTRGGNTVDLKPLVANAMGDVTFTISGESNGCTIDNGVLTSGQNSGTVKINVAVSAKDVNGDTVNEYNEYSLADAITVTINDKETQDALNITSASTVTYGQTLTLISEGGSGTGEITYTVTNGTGEATIDGNVLTPSKVGTVTVIATKAEDATYSSISSAPVVITIEKIKVAVPAEDTTVYTYTGTEQTYVIAENEAYTISGNKQTNANETGYPVTVTLNNTETHAWADDSVEAKNYTFIIGKATITVAAKNQEVYVDGTAPVLGTEHYTVTGLVNGETLKTAPTIEYETTPDTSAAGSVAIKVYGAEAPDGGNYKDIIYSNGTLTIKNRSLNINLGVTTSATFTVRFETNGGSKVKTVTVDKNDVVAEPEAPTKEGYKFDGWYTDSTL